MVPPAPHSPGRAGGAMSDQQQNGAPPVLISQPGKDDIRWPDSDPDDPTTT